MDRGQGLGRGEQLLQTKEKALRVQLLPTIGPPHPGRIVVADADQDSLGALTPQFSAAAHLIHQAGRQAFQAITPHAQVVQNWAVGSPHPLAPQPFTPAPLEGIPPALDAAIAKHHQLLGTGHHHGRSRGVGGEHGR